MERRRQKGTLSQSRDWKQATRAR